MSVVVPREVLAVHVTGGAGGSLTVSPHLDRGEEGYVRGGAASLVLAGKTLRSGVLE